MHFPEFILLQIILNSSINSKQQKSQQIKLNFYKKLKEFISSVGKYISFQTFTYLNPGFNNDLESITTLNKRVSFYLFMLNCKWMRIK